MNIGQKIDQVMSMTEAERNSWRTQVAKAEAEVQRLREGLESLRSVYAQHGMREVLAEIDRLLKGGSNERSRSL